MGLKVLRALDTAKTQIYHFKAIIIAGMGLFTDAYDLFCITPIMKLLGRIYYHSNSSKDAGNEEVPPQVVAIMLAVALLGTACGQIVFGRLGDLIGRRRVYGIALVLMIFSSIGCGFSICRTRRCVLSSLGFFRFALGFGIGGDYPLSATIMSEFANKMTRGAFIAAVFSMQGLGILAGSVVTMTVCAAFKHHHEGNDESTLVAADLAWRLILMFGALPAALTFYWRMMMPETARFTALVELNVLQATKDMEKVLDVSITDLTDEPETKPVSESEPTRFSPRDEYYPLLSKQFLIRHGRHLFACSATWFLLDVVFYSSNLFQSKIYSAYLPTETKLVNAFDEAYHFARLQAIMAVASTIPGYWATVCLIDRIGRVKIQLLGFVALAVGLFAIGIPYHTYWAHHKHNFLFMFLYGLTFFFSNFGPNTTTFIVPAELFPARFRATCHGISGAAGKIGAMLGSISFLWATRTKEDGKRDHHHVRGIGMMGSLLVLAGVSLLGAIVTYFFTPETMGRSLEENEIEFGVEEHVSIQA